MRTAVVFAGSLGCAPGAVQPGPGRDTGGDRIHLSPQQSCDAPRATASWTDASAANDLTAPPTRDDAGGLVVADFDGDGWLDLFTLTADRGGPLWHGGPDGLTRSTEPLRASASAPSLADLDGDGAWEVLLAGREPQVFDPRTGAATPLDAPELDPLAFWRELRAFDADGDGDTDLFAARSRSPEDPTATLTDALLIQDETGRLRIDPDALPAASTARMSFDVVRFDANGDAEPDLYLVHDMGQEHGENTLLQRSGDRFIDVAADHQLDLRMDGMGGHAADIDGDGRLDLLLADTGRSRLLVQRPDGSFADATAAWGADPVTDPRHMLWGAIVADLDHDGWRDLLMLQGPFLDPHDSSPDPQPFTLMRQTDDGLTDASAWLPGERLGSWRAVVADDLNQDGVLDIVMTRSDAPPRLTLSEGCTAAGWLAVVAPDGSRVTVEAGGRAQVALVSVDSGFGANRRPVAWFGLGASQQVDAVTVTLPWTAEERRIEGPFGARRTLTVTH